MKRLLLLVGALLSATACSTLSTLDGARTLEPGEARVSGGLTLQRGNNPLAQSGIPIPQTELQMRIGVAPDVDIGIRAYLVGAGFDVRYRFWHKDKLHLAVQPGLYGLWVPPIFGAGGGSLDWRAPLTAEWKATKWMSLAAGPRVVLRDQWNTVKIGDDKGLASRLDVFSGAGGRVEFHSKVFAVGLGADLYAQPVRNAPLAASAGIDFSLTSIRRRKE